MKLDKIPLTKAYDRRIRLTDEDRETIILRYKQGEGIRAIARDYAGKCSRRLIQFVLFPERDQKLKAQVKKEKRWLKYYDRENHTKSIQSLRKYKKDLISNSKLAKKFGF